MQRDSLFVLELAPVSYRRKPNTFENKNISENNQK